MAKDKGASIGGVEGIYDGDVDIVIIFRLG